VRVEKSRQEKLGMWWLVTASATAWKWQLTEAFDFWVAYQFP